MSVSFYPGYRQKLFRDVPYNANRIQELFFTGSSIYDSEELKRKTMNTPTLSLFMNVFRTYIHKLMNRTVLKVFPLICMFSILSNRSSSIERQDDGLQPKVGTNCS